MPDSNFSNPIQLYGEIAGTNTYKRFRFINDFDTKSLYPNGFKVGCHNYLGNLLFKKGDIVKGIIEPSKSREGKFGNTYAKIDLFTCGSFNGNLSGQIPQLVQIRLPLSTLQVLRNQQSHLLPNGFGFGFSNNQNVNNDVHTGYNGASDIYGNLSGNNQQSHLLPNGFGFGFSNNQNVNNDVYTGYNGASDIYGNLSGNNNNENNSWEALLDLFNP